MTVAVALTRDCQHAPLALAGGRAGQGATLLLGTHLLVAVGATPSVRYWYAELLVRSNVADSRPSEISVTETVDASIDRPFRGVHALVTACIRKTPAAFRDVRVSEGGFDGDYPELVEGEVVRGPTLGLILGSPDQGFVYGLCGFVQHTLHPLSGVNNPQWMFLRLRYQCPLRPLIRIVVVRYRRSPTPPG